MSSMFKKKGGFAFKPKVPTARTRSAAAAAPKPVENQPLIETRIDTPSSDATDGLDNNPPGVDISPSESHSVIGELTYQPRIVDQSKPGVLDDPPLQRSSSSRRGSTTINEDFQETTTSTADIGENISNDADGPLRLKTVAGEPASRPDLVKATSASVNGDSQTRQVQQPSLRSSSDTSLHQAPGLAAVAQAAVPAPSTPAGPPASAPSKKPPGTTSSSKKRAEEHNGEEDDGARPKKRKRNAPQQGRDGTALGVQPQKRKASTSTGTSSAGDPSDAKPRTRKARSLTPEDAEEQTVDLQQLRMADLTKDLRIGKKFSRHDELRDRERLARLKSKVGKDGELMEGVDSGSASPIPDNRLKKSGTPGSSSTPAPAATSGPQFRIVDGQIVVDQSSLVMDRHARAAAAHAGEDMETIEENDFTRLITSSSFMNTSKLKGPNIWNDAETELFYRGLRMFGTEFEMISRMFPGKQRRHIKLKFNREERHNPARIDAALIGEKTIKMDIEEYRAFTGAEYESVETIEAEQRKIQEGYEAERQRVVDEQAEIMRKKRDELFADDDENGGKKKRGKNKGKQAISYGLNGEPIMRDS
ncbi:uncharacterized protein DCS_04782 [Drechmeria coniospora]|uniref:Transcription factor TFIIIB component B'' Myb domain-containing protein n=1 Tax=Drechmeria coniospora TaxID=98403 RepID=A0A151GL10_DRECN|nr:uncharacterized protein DCS_04782 [Drechmeria coniospora]KYK57769.1 uncharacterized protein DCS_04782 [Drechmeria coniospora]